LIDFTAFAKFEIIGKGAYQFLQQSFSNRLLAVGKVRLAHVKKTRCRYAANLRSFVLATNISTW
jgi:glycine cleavage system aminomethyltransferase T